MNKTLIDKVRCMLIHSKLPMTLIDKVRAKDIEVCLFGLPIWYQGL